MFDDENINTCTSISTNIIIYIVYLLKKYIINLFFVTGYNPRIQQATT